ncbi:hypothetical protein UJ101_00689 [Flavobacteriaceae bacterium UJ101]|nr:hypothetical protein UJ101_00689 [Flavobacteriaceae bacterium UJ101]
MKRIILTALTAITLGGLGLGQDQTISGRLTLDLRERSSSGGRDGFYGKISEDNEAFTFLVSREGTNQAKGFGFWNSDENKVIAALKSNTSYVISDKFGIGINNPQAKFEVMDELRVRLAETGIEKNVARIIPLGYSGPTGAINWALRGVYQYPRGVNYNEVGGDLDLIKSLDGNTILATKSDNTLLGKVGIGTSSPDELLTVKGKIHAEEVRVDLSVPADYVFEKYYTGESQLKADYVMPTLEEVETFTKVNNHLPSIPSAQKIQEEGLHLKEMTNLLLQKIEELTLYTIEQQKEIKSLKAKVTQLEKSKL